MTRLLITLLAIALSSGAMAQKMEPIPTSEQTRFLQMPTDQRSAWMKNAFNSADGLSVLPLDILPDTIVAREPLDAYVVVNREQGPTTLELYRIEGRRKKQILSKDFPSREGLSFAVMVWVTIDEPGQYELVAFQNEELMQNTNSDDPEYGIYRRQFEVHERPAAK